MEGTKKSIREGWILNLIDDYGDHASGRCIAIDFRMPRNDELAEEIIKVILDKYSRKETPVQAFRAWNSVLAHFEDYANMHGITSFLQYTDEAKEGYTEFLRTVGNKYGEIPAEDYIAYLTFIPSRIRSRLEEMGRE